jgi:predicted nucleic acid-binding protein
MTVVFADTGFYVAITNSRDALHSRALAFIAGYSGRIVTTEFVLVEVGNFFSRASVRPAFVDLLGRIRLDPNTQIVPASAELFRAGSDLFTARPDKDWSLTDCTSFHVMNAVGITDALATDHHFEQAGFRALLMADGP